MGKSFVGVIRMSPHSVVKCKVGGEWVAGGAGRDKTTVV